MSFIGTSNEEKIWKFLSARGLSDCGIAGLMGNLYAESGLIPTNLQNSYEGKLGMADAEYTSLVDKGLYANFVNDSAGYGLAQWTYWSRKQGLLEYAKSSGRSIGDLEMQLEFLMKELSESFKGVLSVLMTTTSVREASDAVLLQFEKPASVGPNASQQQREDTCVKRAAYSQTYYDKYANQGISKKEVSLMDIVESNGYLVDKTTGQKVIFYECDPAKNHECGKQMCRADIPENDGGFGFCSKTVNPAYRKNGGKAWYAVKKTPDEGEPYWGREYIEEV